MTEESQRGGAETRGGGSSWQDTMQMVAGGRAESWRRMAELSAGVGLRCLRSPEVRESAARIANEVRELTVAEWEVASEWLRAPLWLSGNASPRDLHRRYRRVIDAERCLVRVVLDAAANLQQVASSAIHEAVESGRQPAESSPASGTA